VLKKFHKVQQLMRPRLHNLAQFPQRILHGNLVHAYWSNLDVNFGDAITPLLLGHYGFTPICTTPARAQVVSTGSILHHLPEDFSGCILGSGLIAEEFAKLYPKAKILALRGARSRNLIQASAHVALGDPGLLLPRLLPDLPQRQMPVGVVPHFVDKGNMRLREICARFPTEIKLIDVQSHPLRVLREMAQCEHILSSSLHGLVVADALGIPNRWLVLSNQVKGGRFKFDDYYSAFGCFREPAELFGDESPQQLAELTLAPPTEVPAVQHQLDTLFRDLSNLLL
jgi:pyruvyltransferase